MDPLDTEDGMDALRALLDAMPEPPDDAPAEPEVNEWHRYRRPMRLTDAQVEAMAVRLRSTNPNGDRES